VIAEFIIAAILIEITPGPNMTWLAVLGATHGKRPALAAVAGISLGLAVAAIVAGLGLTALFSQQPALFDTLRWAGTLYLFYLAWDAWRDADKTEDISNGQAHHAFTRGLISNILNPKAYLFYAVFLPRYVSASAPIAAQIALLSAIYVFVASAIHTAIAFTSGSIADWLASSPQSKIVRKALAIAIAIAAVWFFTTTGNAK
jgi:threonine/homoserine/homoserine lactone efflux protein